MPEVPQIVIDVENFQSLYIAQATHDSGPDVALYPELRHKLLSNPELKRRLPEFVHRYPTLKAFWPFIQRKFQHYAERREFIYTSFAPLMAYVEGREGAPADGFVAEVLKPDHEHVKAAWEKALARRESDPEAAITSARTLLESVCKTILDEGGVDYDHGIELPKLYKEAARTLNLAPEQHQEQIFKQILSGCATVVEGLGSLRNALSDAHGKGKRAVRAEARHAELAVNLACSMASFLMRTHEKRKAGR